MSLRIELVRRSRSRAPEEAKTQQEQKYRRRPGSEQRPIGCCIDGGTPRFKPALLRQYFPKALGGRLNQIHVALSLAQRARASRQLVQLRPTTRCTAASTAVGEMFRARAMTMRPLRSISAM